MRISIIVLLIKNSVKVKNYLHKNHASSSCQTKYEYQCLNRILDMVLFDFFLKGSLRKTCDTLEYSGEIRLRKEPVEDFKKIRFQYNLDRIMKVQEEYLIYDEVGMIGSVGGTFGMFIGFSFANIVSQILNLIEKFNARSKS